MEDSLIFDFDKDSTFLIDLRKKNYNSLVKNIGDFNELIPKESEILILDDFSNEINNNNIEGEEKNSDEISIVPDFKTAILTFVPGIKNFSKYEIINDIIKKCKKRERLSLKYISLKYKNKTNHSISKTSISYILRNKLNLKYLKTTTKSDKLKEASSKIRAFIFIKIIIKALLLKMNIIYLDETNVQLENNHLRVWRYNGECPYFKSDKRGRKNIIMAISSKKVIYYEINNGTNDSNSFLSFMEKLTEKMNEEEMKNSLIIMDNCSIHLTTKLREFYSNKKLKILTIVPYLSQFNAIEFFFNFIKQKLYKKVFNSFKNLIPFVEDIINNTNTEKILSKIYVKTINIYKEFINKNMSHDLNSDLI